MYDSLNCQLFEGRLPPVMIEYSDRMLAAGTYTPGLSLIKIGRRYHEIFPDDLADTLKHEMIHVLYPSHNRQFRHLAKRFGVALKAREHPALRLPHKYLYVCPRCGREYPRRKKLRQASCGICTPGREYDPRFRLIPVKKKRSG